MAASQPLAVQGDLPLAQGKFRQHMEIPGVWLERGSIKANDTRLIDSPRGLAGQRCMATLVFAAGSAIAAERSDRALVCARELLEASELRLTAGATSPHQQVIVLRVLSPVTEPGCSCCGKCGRRGAKHCGACRAMRHGCGTSDKLDHPASPVGRYSKSPTSCKPTASHFKSRLQTRTCRGLRPPTCEFMAGCTMNYPTPQSV